MVFAVSALAILPGAPSGTAASKALAADHERRVGASVLGGRNLSLFVEEQRPRAVLRWDTGSGQDGYRILASNGTFASVEVVAPVAQNALLPANETGFVDSRPPVAHTTCYMVQAMGPNGTVLGNSDVLCAYHGSGIKRNEAGSVSITLNQSSLATVSWFGHILGGFGTTRQKDSYVIVAMDMTTEQLTTSVVPGSQTNFFYNTRGNPHCFAVVGIANDAFSPSAPDITCAFPGMSSP
jgi:hypothetical protein